MAGAETTSIRLRDGRALAWCEYGDPAGPPLLFFHGLPGSRLFHLPGWLRPGGTRLRIIVPDRPGMGLSTFQPGRRLLDWAGDMHALATHLGLRRWLVAGISGGGPHAIACAARLPGEVAGCALLSSASPLDDPAITRAMHAGNRLIFTLARRAPALLGPLLWAASRTSTGPDQAQALRGAARMLPPADIEAMRDPELYGMLSAAGREATRAGVRGVVQEAVILSRPWGFSPAEVGVPAFLWQGGQDRSVPVAAGRLLAAQIPRCTAHFEPEAGHLFCTGRWPEIEAALLSSW